MVLFFPRLLFAVLVFILGLIIAGVLKALVVRVVTLLKIDELMDKLEVADFFQRIGIKLNVAEFLGWIVKWFIVIVSLIASADALGWSQVTVFLSTVVSYLPNVLIAVIILLVGLILANFVYEVVKKALDAAGLVSSQFLAGISRWSIIVFSFMAALVQLGIAESLIQVLFTGFVAMISLAGGLAFGLGGREHAKKVLDKLSKDLGGDR
ncbi:hypothetical protein D6827_02870 [Candidatus Parcubacteria bacterium]|nr:MAG: hypothetical protein D6827_02870 [Candidatus Parcubacteria bacterium]